MTLRLMAIAIALAGVIDPAFTMPGHARARVAIVIQDGPTMALPAGGGESRRAVAARMRQRLAGDLGDAYDIQPRLTSDASAVVVIGDAYSDWSARAEQAPPLRPAGATGSAGAEQAPPPHPVVATVTVDGDITPNVRIVRVGAPRDVPIGTAIRVGVDVEGVGVNGKTSTLVVRIAGLEVGRASHQWRGDRERWPLDIDAVPVGEPPFLVSLEAQPLDVDRTPIDNTADAVVDVRRTPLRVEVYEPRPSWATTFVRRALEADARFHVAGLSATSKSIATRTRDAASLADPALDTFDVVIVGGLDRLTAADARALDGFMRERGGAVVLVPDARIAAGPALDMLHGLTLTERLSERPETLAVVAPLAPIQASELLLMAGDEANADRIAWASGASPATVVGSMPRGDGRLVVAGALDAWRFRTEDEGAFDRFWQSTVAGLALAAPPPVDVTVVPPILKPGERGEIVVRARSAALPAPRSAEGKGPPYGRPSNGPSGGPSVRAAIDGRPIRLWPEAEAGVFRGSFTASDAAGRSTVVAHVDAAMPVSASRPVLVDADAHRPLPAAVAPLSLLSLSHQGIDVTPHRVAELESFIRRTVAPPPSPVTRRPMRSAWWIIPFAACLSAEWWMRRRRGLR